MDETISQKLIKKHVTHPVCLTLAGEKEHMKFCVIDDLAELWDTCFVFGAADPDKLPEAIWHKTVETKCGKLLN